jgi:uncharacterized NAD(P)/FAD-binding protein YdhS
VYCSDATGGQGTVIAVIGGGASGTLAVIHLLRLAAAGHGPLRIALIDRHGRHGLGQAYSTTHPGHALNSPAGQMSAVAGDPGHLLRWADATGIAHNGFLPRPVYGRYLLQTLAEAERDAHPMATVRHITSQVVAVAGGAPGHPMRLRLAADGHIDADVAVLATGHQAPAAPCPVPPRPRYIPDPWAPGALPVAAQGRPVVIIGTGLTMVDVAIAVTDASPGTVVHAVSRHGLLPQVHRGDAAATAGSYWLPVFAQNAGPVRLTDLMWQVRMAIGDNPARWQDIVDALRPHVPALWQRLPLADKRLFLRHVARYWEVHRHRIPPQTASRVAALRASGRLVVHAGRVTGVSQQADGLRVSVAGEGGARDLAAGWLINATGPATNIAATTDPLLRDVLGQGLARPDPLGLGLDACPSGALVGAGGRPSSMLFTLGPTLRGSRYETTAIPEIRDQAAALAKLISATHAPRQPVTAA